MKVHGYLWVGCMLALACGSDDKALRSPGPGASSVTTIGAAGAPPVNTLPPPIAVGPQIVQPGAAGSGAPQTLTDPFGVAGNDAVFAVAGSAAISGAAGSGF